MFKPITVQQPLLDFCSFILALFIFCCHLVHKNWFWKYFITKIHCNYFSKKNICYILMNWFHSLSYQMHLCFPSKSACSSISLYQTCLLNYNLCVNGSDPNTAKIYRKILSFFKIFIILKFHLYLKVFLVPINQMSSRYVEICNNKKIHVIQLCVFFFFCWKKYFKITPLDWITVKHAAAHYSYTQKGLRNFFFLNGDILNLKTERKCIIVMKLRCGKQL